jgi:hypothetical protein
MQNPPQSECVIPGKIQAAQTFLYYCQAVESNNACGALPGDAPRAGGELSSLENVTKNAALDLLRNYFNGEIDFADGREVKKKPEEGDTGELAKAK